MRFTDAELDLITHCLSIAGDTLQHDAAIADMANTPRIAERFREVAQQARELRERIDNRE